jgi:hypothetical protein
MISNFDRILSEQERQNPFVLDVENNQEHCTPYLLAVLRENFESADFMCDNKLANPFYKNQDGETVFDIVNRLKILNVQKYLVDNS